MDTRTEQHIQEAMLRLMRGRATTAHVEAQAGEWPVQASAG